MLNPLYEKFQCVYQVCGMSETFLNMLCIMLCIMISSVSDKSVFVLQKCSRIILTIEHKLMFHVLVHYKYSVVNIIACFAGPTTWGQREQRPGDRGLRLAR